MQVVRTAVSRVLIFVFAATCMQELLLAQMLQRLNDKRGDVSSPIRLVLQTSKGRYQADEAIEIIAYLENVTDKSYYVGNILVGFWGSAGLHDIRLTIIDENGREVVIGRGAGTWIWKSGTTISEKLARAYVELRPKMIHGVKESISLPPGLNRLTATYREIEAQSWTEEERNALMIPVWIQPLVSNTVTITVLPSFSTSTPSKH